MTEKNLSAHLVEIEFFSIFSPDIACLLCCSVSIEKPIILLLFLQIVSPSLRVSRIGEISRVIAILKVDSINYSQVFLEFISYFQYNIFGFNDFDPKAYSVFSFPIPKVARVKMSASLYWDLTQIKFSNITRIIRLTYLMVKTAPFAIPPVSSSVSPIRHRVTRSQKLSS